MKKIWNNIWKVTLIFIILFEISFSLDLLIEDEKNSTIPTPPPFNKELEQYKNSIKEKIIKNAIKCEKLAFRSLRAVDRADSPDEFFCDEFEDKLPNLPTKGDADVMPWSGYYWPIKNGVISVRYGINEKNTIREYNPSTHTLTKAYKYEESITKYKQPEEHKRISLNSSIETYINEYYSPSEKYDYLIGDYEYTLTNNMKTEGYYVRRDPDGDVAVWMGICHGWSPASYKEKRAKKTVTVLASDGKTQIEFLPDDIKALVTLYWAEAKYNTRFIGGRCKYENHKEIPSDPETGLWEESTCFSINPASLVITMANQIGIRKRNLIFDPDTNGEIWNQPVYGYEMKYFNIISTKEKSLNEAKISVEEAEAKPEVKILKYISKKRDTRTKFFVGVKMTVDFIFELNPVHSEKLREDNKSSKSYSFVLELDEEDRIVGGEWLHNTHPTFIWMPDEHTKLHSSEDDLVQYFNGTVTELRNIKNVAVRASKKKTVLKAIVDYLLELSSDTY